MPTPHTFNNWSNPDGIKTHPSNVVQLRLQSLESSSAVLAKITTGAAAAVALVPGDAIRQRKVYVATLPSRCVCSQD